MAMDNNEVRAWKEYGYGPADEQQESPVGAVDIADVEFGGLKALSWEWSFSCCGTTLCSDCTI